MINSRLDERKQFLLRAIVHDYVATAEPVASQILVQRYQLPVKSATVRNEMSEMSELGLLVQPHTSAGRIPSSLGYRFYVDHLMPMVAPPEPAVSIAKELSDEIDEVLLQTCRLLTHLTHYMAIATAPESASSDLREVHLSYSDARRCLMVVVTGGGEVRYRTLELGESLAASDLTQLGNRLTEQLQGSTVEILSLLLIADGEDRPEGSLRQVIEAIRDLLTSQPNDEVVVAGSRQILQQPEFKDVHRLRNLLEVLEERKSVLELLREAVLDPSVQIVIGEENPEVGLRECSLIAARYSAKPGVYGAIGIIGPTRMTYSSAVPTVQSVAQFLSDFFTR